MRLVTFSDGKATRIGALQGDAVLDITAADPALPKDMLGLIAGGAAMLAAARDAVARAPVVAAARLLAGIAVPQRLAP